MSQSAEILKHQFYKSLGLPWMDILPSSRLDEILEEEEISYRSRVYSPSLPCGQCSTKRYQPIKA